MRYEDLTGRRFGRLIVLERTDSHVKKNGDKQTAFLCRCDCGNVRKVLAYNLKKRKNRLITYKNITHTLAEWSGIVKIKPSTIANRINSGWTIEDALFKPLRGEKNVAS